MMVFATSLLGSLNAFADASKPLFVQNIEASEFYDLTKLGGAQSNELSLPKRSVIKKTRIKLRLPGEGAVQLELDEKVNKTWRSFSSGRDGKLHEDPIVPLLYQGNVARGRIARHAQVSKIFVAGSVIDGKFELTFTGTPRSSGSPLYKIYGTVGSKKARVSRIPRGLKIPEACATEETHAHAASDSNPAQKDVGIQSVRVVEVATDADFAFKSAYGSEANAKIAATINGADALYRTYLGLTLQIVRQHVYDSETVYTSTDASSLLTQFRTNTSNSTNLGSADVFHMFTAKDLDGSTIGIAYVGAACYDPFKYGLTQYISAYAIATFTHEVGHNLNAQHTTEGVMAPSVSGGTQYFSQVSIGQINSFLDSSNADCLSVSDVDPTPVPTSTPTPVATPTITPTPGGGGGLPPPPEPTATPDPGDDGGDDGDDVNSDEAMLTLKTTRDNKIVTLDGRMFNPFTGDVYGGKTLSVLVDGSDLIDVTTNSRGKYRIRLRGSRGARYVLQVAYKSKVFSKEKVVKIPRRN